MFGDNALKLVTEAKACIALDTIKPYNDELVRTVLQETRQLHTHLSMLVEQLEQSVSVSVDETASLQSQLLMLHLMVQYNKRGLLVYASTRIDLLSRMFSLSPSTSLPSLFAAHPGLKTSLSSKEHDFLRSLAKLHHHQSSTLDKILPDLASANSSIHTPIPTSTLATVKFTKSLDQVFLNEHSTAPQSFQRGQTLTLNRSDALTLARSGACIVLDHAV
ncbi:hypothetical protein BCV70DRAFT_163325 [Testicularia cyperi]|uniref:DNA replication complex GINS protein PSF1 n=1 Tax=Testicularia cyperi TaxID=1882483 RepID=A0A317XM84_9BASI|nr:hypothetical protein BCV70DRAFT_163325 [Testicularia cyperi]